MMNRKPPLLLALVILLLIAIPSVIYQDCRIDVPNKHIAILTRKTGEDLENGQVIAPSAKYKGVQREVLSEGRYYYNPYVWDWEVVPHIEIPQGKMGVRIRLYGEDLPAGEIIASKENQKGIVAEVMRPGRYPINAWVAGSERLRDNYAEMIELHDPVTIPAGYKGLVTELTAPMPKLANELLSQKGERGVQAESLEPGTYYLNPCMQEIRLIDCHSQRFNLKDIGFPTRDGFWVSLEAVIEFRVKPEQAAATYVLYNEERCAGVECQTG